MLLTSILNGVYPSGSTLPNARNLSAEISATRPTLRETLQRLANEGWIRIQHGKPTAVNDFWGKARFVSRTYYQKLSRVIEQGDKNVEKIVKNTMQQSIAIWQAAKSKKGDIPCGAGMDGGIQISK